MLSQAKRDRDTQAQLRQDFEIKQNEVNQKERALNLKDAEIDEEREGFAQRDIELSRLEKQLAEELESTKQSRERAVRLEEESEQRAKLVKLHLEDLTEREARLSKVERSVNERNSQLDELIESARGDQDIAKQARAEAQALREDAEIKLYPENF